VIIIIGASKSGSTLLAKTIGGHTKCFTLGEINRFNAEVDNPNRYCGCGEKILNCDFWKNIVKELEPFKREDSNTDFNMGIFKQITKKSEFYKLFPTILLRKKYHNKKVDSEIKNTLNLYKTIFKQTDSKVLIDSTKGLFRALILDSNKNKDINFQFIHLLRDGRGVLNSSLKKTYTIQHKNGKIKEYRKEELMKPIHVKSPSEAINYWLYVNIRNFLILKLFRNNQTIFMKYEDFTSDPKKCLKSIFKKVSLSYEDSVLNLGQNENHILGGNSSRINAKKIKKQDDAWRTNLDVNILEKFNKRAGWFNKLLGYR